MVWCAYMPSAYLPHLVRFYGKDFFKYINICVVPFSNFLKPKTFNMKVQDKEYVQFISETIRKIKKCSGEERKSLIVKVKKKFQMEENEKWVITQLRMILVDFEADLKFFEIHHPNRRISAEKQRKQSDHLKTSRKGQTSPTEKQLLRLRNVNFNDSKLEKPHLTKNSKLEYFNHIGLKPNVISL